MSDQHVRSAFEPVEFLGLHLRNRFIRSATMEGMVSTGGVPTAELMNLYQAVAKGGTGFISTSGCLPDPSWSIGPQRQLLLDAGTHLSAWEAFTRVVHDQGALISLQMSPFVRLGDRWVGPSEYRPGILALTREEIDLIVSIYGKMSALVRRVGFDAVQVHAGHGYGLAQFLSPYFNRREDLYGGSAENRARILVQIRRAIGENAGVDFPVWIKMNSFDGIPGGLDPEQAAEYAPLLEAAGYGAIEVTGGAIGGSHNSRGPVDKSQWFEGFYLEGAARVKAVSHLPVSAVGGIRRPEMIERILSEGVADMISLSRPLIREPDLIHRWAKGDRAPSRCVSCNGCFESMMKGEGLFCVQDKHGNRQGK